MLFLMLSATCSIISDAKNRAPLLSQNLDKPALQLQETVWSQQENNVREKMSQNFEGT